MGLGGQGLTSDLPKSENENKIISYCKAFSIHEGFEIIGACDPDENKRKLAEKHYGINTYKTLKDCKEHFDIAVVATPDNYHFPILKQLSKRKPRLVICEKPICEDLKQAKEIVKLYNSKKISLAVNYTRRFLPHYDYLKQYGKPIYATCSFNRGLLHTASHAVDLFNMLGVDNYKLIEIPTNYRVWDIKVYYKNYKFSEVRLGKKPVWDYYDNSHWHVVENVYNFLEGKEPLKCTGEDGLRALETCYKLTEVKKIDDKSNLRN